MESEAPKMRPESFDVDSNCPFVVAVVVVVVVVVVVTAIVAAVVATIVILPNGSVVALVPVANSGLFFQSFGMFLQSRRLMRASGSTMTSSASNWNKLQSLFD